MKRDDALRKLRALNNLVADEGAFPAEVENARALIRQIEERYAVDDPGPEQEPPLVPDWPYWESILREFGIKGHRFLKSASAVLDPNRSIIIRLDSGEWEIQRKTRFGYQMIVRNHNPESLRAYLRQNSPRKYTFAQASGF